MDAKTIEELRGLDAKATPGPWEARACSVVTPRSGFDIDGIPRPEEADLIAAARNALGRLLDEREALLAAIKKIQWSGHSGVGHGDPGFNLCPECKAASPDSGWRNAGRHETNCSIGAAIAKAEAP